MSGSRSARRKNRKRNYNPFQKYGNRDILVVPQEVRETLKDGPVVYFKHYQFFCPNCCCEWTKGSKNDAYGSKCRNCQMHVFPHEATIGYTPYQGGRRMCGKFVCQNCHRFWISIASWANLCQLCLVCDAKVYPFWQSYLRRSKRSRNNKDENIIKRHMSDLCERCIKSGINCVNGSAVFTEMPKTSGKKQGNQSLDEELHVDYTTGSIGFKSITQNGLHTQHVIAGAGDNGLCSTNGKAEPAITINRYKKKKSFTIPIPNLTLESIPEVFAAEIESPRTPRQGCVFPGDQPIGIESPRVIRVSNVDLKNITANQNVCPPQSLSIDAGFRKPQEDPLAKCLEVEELKEDSTAIIDQDGNVITEVIQSILLVDGKFPSIIPNKEEEMVNTYQPMDEYGKGVANIEVAIIPDDNVNTEQKYSNGHLTEVVETLHIKPCTNTNAHTTEVFTYDNKPNGNDQNTGDNQEYEEQALHSFIRDENEILESSILETFTNNGSLTSQEESYYSAGSGEYSDNSLNGVSKQSALNDSISEGDIVETLKQIECEVISSSTTEESTDTSTLAKLPNTQLYS